ALVLCWLGDVLLLGRGRGTGLRLGLASFLLGHVAYAVAFTLRGLDPLACLAAAAGLLVPGFLVLRWLLPQAPSDWRIPVLAYAAVISVMAVSALGGISGPGGGVIALGALAFYASDLAVARERFVQSSFANKAWGLPLYYGAQLLLAGTATSV
ncbi:MAG: lysoplasmalogenase, partial [Myxococcota bacterium]